METLSNYTHIEIDSFGTTRYYNAEGKLHRIDGPAIEWQNGTKWWYLNGLQHKTDGPAIEWPDGSKSWWVDGIELTEEEFLQRTTVQEFSMDEIADKLGIPVELLKIKK